MCDYQILAILLLFTEIKTRENMSPKGIWDRQLGLNGDGKIIILLNWILEIKLRT